MTVQPVASVSHQMMPHYCALSVRINVDAHAGGRINNELSTDKVEKQKYGPASSLNFTAGEGDGRINIDTVSGRITLKHD
jgi:DUF4097 and DUF4098 domain-containing protein YvlB